MYRLRIATLATVAVLMIPMAATAAPVNDQYGNPVAGQSDSPADTAGGGDAAVAGEAAGPDTIGGLPFTGAELGLIVLAGAAIAGSGIALRRVGRPRKQRRAAS